MTSYVLSEMKEQDRLNSALKLLDLANNLSFLTNLTQIKQKIASKKKVSSKAELAA